MTHTSETPTATAGERRQRVYGYARVSTDRQAQQGASLADQEQRIRGYAQSLNVAVDEVFVEAGVSGGKSLNKRPKGAVLMKVAQAGDIIIATKLDRMFRSASDALIVVEQLATRSIHLHLMDVGGDVTGNGVAKLVFSILASVAEMEKSRISERVRDVKEHLRAAGRFTGGKTPAGHHVTKDKRLVLDDHWQQVLDTMRASRDAGVSYGAIATKIRADYGIAMSVSTCYRTLRRGEPSSSDVPVG